MILRTASLVGCLLMAVTPLAAQEQQRWYERLRFDGDFRVRYESFRQEEAEDRGRLRIRLRAGFTLPITSTLTTGFRLASAEPGSVTSHNVNLSGGLTPKNLFIDRAWLSWTPSDRFTITGGTFGNPLERAPGLMRSELIFDDEVAPEGFHQQVTLVASDDGVLRWLAVLGEQWTLQEFSDRADSWMLGGQAVMHLAASERSRITLTAGYYGFLRGNALAQARNSNSALFITNAVVLEDGTVLEGGQSLSPPTGNPFQRFANDFRLINGSAGISLDRAVGSSPIQLYGDVVYNDGAEDQNLGWWAGLSVGAIRQAGDWAIAGLYTRVEQESVLSMYSYSDLGLGGTNVEGPILSLQYRPMGSLTLSYRHHLVRPVTAVAGLSDERLHRILVDAAVSF